MRGRLCVLLAVAFAAAAALVLAAPALAVANLHDGSEALADIDVRADVAPSAVQREAAREVGAAVTWNQLGTPSSIVRYGGFVTRGVAGRDASAAALNWLSANEALFGLGSTDVLRLYSDT